MLIKDGKLNLVNLALMIYVFSIIVFNEGTTALKIVRVFFVGVVAIHIISTKKLYLNAFAYWLLVFWGFCALSINWTINIENTKNMVFTLAYNLICGFCLLNLLCEDKNRIILIFKTIIFSSIIFFGRIAIDHGILVYTNGARGGYNGLESANTVGMIAAIATILGIYCIKDKKCKYPIIYFVAVFLNVAIILFSASRKAILYALIPLLVYYIINSKNTLKVLKNIIVAIISLILIYLAIMKVSVLYDMIGNRIETMVNGLTGEGEVDASTSLRLRMIDWGMEWFQENPWIGYGIDSYKALLGTKGTSFGTSGAYAHNNYIELMVDIGIIGLAIYYYIYIYMFGKSLKCMKNRNLLFIFMFGILLACAINEYGQVAYYYKFNQLILLLSYIIIENEAKKEKNNVKQ